MKKNPFWPVSIVLVILLLFSLFQVYRHTKAFEVSGVLYSEDGEHFRPVDMPLFKDEGFLMINFTSDKQRINPYFYAIACVKEVRLNRGVIYSGPCVSGAEWRKVCEGLGFYPDTEKTNIMSVEIGKGVVDVGKRPNYFFVENEDNGVMWRILSFSLFAVLIVLGWMRLTGRDIRLEIGLVCNKILSNKSLVLLLAVSLTIQLLVSASGKSVDVDNWILWTENLIHKKDFNRTSISPDYYYIREVSYLNKPPGAYLYPFFILRLLFGFTSTYAQQLVKLPAILGNLLVGYAIWKILEGKKFEEKILVLATSLYLFNPGVILQGAYLGKHDSLTIALLLLAIKNIDKGRFSIYYGMSVVSKQFPLLILPWLLIQKKMFKKLFYSAMFAILLTLPFLIPDPLFLIERMITTHTEKLPLGISWMTNLVHIRPPDAILFSKIMLVIYFTAIILTAYRFKTDGFSNAALVYCLFLVFSKVVYEQYILWTMPFLLLVYFNRKMIAPLTAFVVASITCAVWFEYTSLLPKVALNKWKILLAVAMIVSSITIIRASNGQGKTCADYDRQCKKA